LCSAEGHGVASLLTPGATHFSIHADVNFVVACRCAQDPVVHGQISLRKCGHDAARAVVGDLEHDVVADPKFSPHPLALHELGPAQHLGHVVLEPRRRHSVVGLVHPWIGIEPVVRHDPVDQVVDDRGDPCNK